MSNWETFLYPETLHHLRNDDLVCILCVWWEAFLLLGNMDGRSSIDGKRLWLDVASRSFTGEERMHLWINATLAYARARSHVNSTILHTLVRKEFIDCVLAHYQEMYAHTMLKITPTEKVTVVGRFKKKSPSVLMPAIATRIAYIIELSHGKRLDPWSFPQRYT